ncbi:hypothetical protein [Geopsychrobacter electrodiphilus]|uniref:hypothetical protein n=1 Tax=Geopsychrobacter electrodiphilus TaxID=225196 RepID=UPI0004758262|nr:hypothetical protein [Geopsychrobacter electrodiphilus]
MMDSLPVSPLRVPLKKSDLVQMLELLRLSWKLQAMPAYQQLIAAELPASARMVTGTAGVMMGYDFHLTEDGPRLIEINTNAGGSALALRACHGEPTLTPSLKRRLGQMFEREWSDFCEARRPLQRLVILDENPQQQHLYPEMKRFAGWLEAAGIEVHIVDPVELEADARGVSLAGKVVDLIYNRHCDFYLDDISMAGIRSAYLARKVCLTPNPFIYGQLGDKRRLKLWTQAEKMAGLGLSVVEIGLLQRLIPASCLLADFDPNELWELRKEKVFKPVARYGSKGVLLGKTISRKRFAELEPFDTLVQQLVPPSQISDPAGNAFKLDLRLYAWRNHALGIAARLYQGQVTNLNTVGGGFAAVVLESNA